MKVIGLSPLDKDSTVTVVEDGEITYAAAEERFTRVKLQDGFPWHALADALQATRTDPADVQSVMYPFLGWEEETRLFERNLAEERDFLDDAESPETSARMNAASERVPHRTGEIPGLRNPNERMDKGFAKTLAYRFLANESVVSRNVAKRGSTQWGRDASAFHRKWHEELETALDEFGLTSRLKRVEHHASHAANAYYTSGFDEALVVTLDGYGSGLAGSIGIGRNGTIERIHCLQYPHSLGTFYESVTSALGFQPSRHEGKIVGLAAYGDPAVLRDVLLSRFAAGGRQLPDSRSQQRVLLAAARYPISQDRRGRSVPARTRARGLQLRLPLPSEDGPQEPRALGRRRRQRQVESAAEGDCRASSASSSTRTWATAAAARARRSWSSPATAMQTRCRSHSRTCFSVLHLPPNEIADALTRAQLAFTKYTPIEPKIAALIAAGKVVARFNGRMEYGPRALGNRSILYHAKEPAVNQWLNQRLGRTEFMPFAPATLFEKRHECYRNIDGAEHAA